MNSKVQAEKVAEAFAQDFLETEFGNDIFIGSHIEQLLDDKVHLIYQYTEDEKYHGAAITDHSGEEFIVLNTFQPLRMRYFTAAHELWHLSEGSVQMQGETFDHERAADRFAAAIMMPKGLTKDLWRKFKKTYEHEEAVIHLADIASMPYEAAARRLKELDERVSGLDFSEEEWIQKRSFFSLPDSLLDQTQFIEKFDAYEEIVRDAVSEGKLDKLTAANKIGRYNSELAEEWQKQETESHQQREYDDA